MDPLARREFLKKTGHCILASSLVYRARAQSTPPKLTLNIRDFGATGDGTSKDTAAIQQSIDRCWVLGGGEVLVPAGIYLTGAIALKSNTILRLDKDATILGTPDFADYPVTQVRWEGKWIQGRTGLNLCDQRRPHRRRRTRQDRRQRGVGRPARGPESSSPPGPDRAHRLQ